MKYLNSRSGCKLPHETRAEKEHFVRLSALQILFESIVSTYAAIKSTDKTFLSELRQCKTRLQKAIDIRLGYLDKDASSSFVNSVRKMQLMFVPTLEARKEQADLLKLQSVLPMAIEDFNTWYEFVIEHTCRTCTRADYSECPARRVLIKYGVYPYNPEARGKCQYSYVEVD